MSDSAVGTPAAPPAMLPVLPLKNTVLFPFLFAPLSVGRPASVAAVEAALAHEEKTIIAVSQKNGEGDSPNPDDLFRVGTKAVIKKFARNEDAMELLAQGLERVAILQFDSGDGYLRAVVQPLPLPQDTGAEVDALFRSVIEMATKAINQAEFNSSLR